MTLRTSGGSMREQCQGWQLSSVSVLGHNEHRHRRDRFRKGRTTIWPTPINPLKEKKNLKKNNRPQRNRMHFQIRDELLSKLLTSFLAYPFQRDPQNTGLHMTLFLTALTFLSDWLTFQSTGATHTLPPSILHQWSLLSRWIIFPVNNNNWLVLLLPGVTSSTFTRFLRFPWGTLQHPAHFPHPTCPHGKPVGQSTPINPINSHSTPLLLRFCCSLQVQRKSWHL